MTLSVYLADDDARKRKIQDSPSSGDCSETKLKNTKKKKNQVILVIEVSMIVGAKKKKSNLDVP